ncbi:MAG: ATP-binding cassette domain-containing protein [Candidatus Omnitrophica bacterium]|nr:ATP-binding cassette domain-containing protein [Candidatus Omnitrophota bacterium]
MRRKREASAAPLSITSLFSKTKQRQYTIMEIESHRSKLNTFVQFAQFGLCYKARLIYIALCSGAISILTLLTVTMLKPVMGIIFNPEEAIEPSGRLVSVLGWLYGIIDWMYRAFGDAAKQNPIIALSIVCFFVIVIVFVKGVFQYIQSYLVHWIGNRVILDLQNRLFERMLHFDAAYYSRNKVGYLLSYYTVDARVIGMSILYVFGRMILDPFLLAGALAYLLWMQWQLTLLYALIFPAILFTVRYFARKNRRAGRRAQNIIARLGAFLQEHFSAIRLVQGYSMYNRQRRMFAREIRGVFDAMMAMARATSASSPINEFLGVFALCCVLLLAGSIVLSSGRESGTFDGGDLMVYAGTLALLYQPIKRIERAVQQIQHGLAAAERVFEALQTDASLPQLDAPETLSRFEREVAFEKVAFSYDGQTDVLREISFVAKKGEQIALVGPSGAGKSTLVNLIPRFYDPTDGAIRMDGKDLRDLSIEDLRRQIGMVFQDVMILGDAVRLNITCGDESYTEEQIMAAAKAAYAHEFITALPQGYDTVIGERGESLSGGQCQRIAIARAFLRDAPILILDEATSSLDSESELHIKQSLRRLMQGRTSFVIAHRLSTILQADRILVLDQGEIVDAGRHSELLQRCSLYQRLHRLQFSGEDQTAPPA